MESGYFCGNPNCRHILTLELHHMVRVADGGGNEASNLLALCPNCHALHTKGHIPVEAIRHWKGMLVAMNHAFSKESMDLLLFLHSGMPQPFRISGDGVLKFVSLAAAGLAKTSMTSYQPPAGPGLAPESALYKVRLTQKGRALIEAWLAGDEEGYREALSEEPEQASEEATGDDTEEPGAVE